MGLDWYDPNLANEDPNNDGLTNLQEYQAGGNPDYPIINTRTGVGYTSLQAAYNAAQNGDTFFWFKASSLQGILMQIRISRSLYKGATRAT